MKKVSIFLILLTMTMTTIHVDEIKDLMMLLSICMLFYLFGFYVTRKINLYFQRKRLENDFANIFTDEFLAKLKREVTISKFKNELEKICCTELCSNQSEQDNEKQNF